MIAPPQPGVYVPGGLPTTINQTRRKALFLDRDGVINVNHGYVSTPDQTEWVPGIFELCAAARDAGYVLVVVTNQAGIARGYYSEEDFLKYTRWMCGEFAARGLEILATVYCPHHPTEGLGPLRVVCECRKPAPGMFFLVSALFHIDPTQSVVVGDKGSDLMAASGAGVMKGFLIEPDNLDPFGDTVSYLNSGS